MKDFIVGVNYWASHAGTDMWKNWREDVVAEDLELLAEYGIEVLRVFPNWRDFQPVEPAFGGSHRLYEYRMTDDGYPENLYYLDETMLERFEQFCRIAEEKGLKLIVGLMTGWMSGRLFVPPVLYEKNIYTDPAALYFEQLLIKGLVTRMKGQKSICAWDLGNECNCMDQADKREEAYSWSLIMVNCIKACDATRPVVSGMHSLELEGVWNIQDQGELADILTTHPYPFWVEHCNLAPLTDFRTLLHGTAQTQYYATAGGKPCLVEELGSMGPMVCSEEKAADFLKVNLWSNWANGAAGLLWWCAYDQSLLTAPPYDWNMCERELGMVSVKKEPKPTLVQMQIFRDQMKELALTLPRRQTDGICILSRGQDHWGIAYMSYILAKQAELTLDFAYCEQPLPDSRLYFLPSVSLEVMSRKSYDSLKKRVYHGAVLYLSIRDGIFTEFEELTGFHVEYAHKTVKSGCTNWDGKEISYWKPYHVEVLATRAVVLAEDEEGTPLFGAASYGAGTVYFLNFPLEEMLLTREQGFEEKYYRFYAKAAEQVLKDRGIRRNNPYVGITLHEGREADYAVLVNYTSKTQEPAVAVKENIYSRMEVLWGDAECMEAFGAAVLKLCK